MRRRRRRRRGSGIPYWMEPMEPTGQRSNEERPAALAEHRMHAEFVRQSEAGGRAGRKGPRE